MHEPGGAWHRVHPLSPLIRSWQAIALVIFFIGRDAGESLLTGDRDDGPWLRLPGRDVGLGVWLTGGGLVVVALVVVVALMVLSWRMTRYRITADSLELRSGVVWRQHRRAQLDRLQAVDVVQPLLARIFGLARLTVEVAGAGTSAIQLSYLTESRARSLRNQLLASSAGLTYTEEEAPEAPEHHWLEVPVPRLVGSIALSGATAGFLVSAVVLVILSFVLGTAAPAAGIVPWALGSVGALWSRFSRGFGFRVATSPDGLRLRHGLVEARAQTVPPGRVQAVQLTQPLLWRRTDWWQVQVNVAGYGAGGGGDASSGNSPNTLLPVGTRDEAIGVLSFVIPQLGTGPEENPRLVIEAALDGTGGGSGFVTSPAAARRLDPLSWRRNGFRVTDTALLIRRGRLRRTVIVVPHARTQSLGIVQGPWDRRLGLASFALHSTPGPITPMVAHLAEGDAARLLTEQSERAQRARAAAGPERWMQIARQADAPSQLPPPLPPVDAN